MPRLCIVALCGAASLFAARAQAQTAPVPPPMMRLEWVRGAGAERCPSTPVIARAVEARIGRPLFAMDAPQSAEVSIQRGPQQWTVAIFLRDRDGALLGSRTLSSEQPDCEAVAASVIFSIALAIDPEAALRPQSATQTSATPQTANTAQGARVESAPIPSGMPANAVRAMAAALTQSALTSSIEAQRAHLRERQEAEARIRAEDQARERALAAERAAQASAAQASAAGANANASTASSAVNAHAAITDHAQRSDSAANAPLVPPPILPPPTPRAVLGAGSVALGAWANWGLLPQMAAGPTLEGYARIYQRIGVRGALRWLPEQEIDTAQLGLVSFGLVAGQVALDVELFTNQRWSVSVYGGALLSAIHAIVHERAPADTGERFSLDLGLGATGALHVYGPLSLLGSLELATPLIRYRYRVEGDLSSTVYEQPWITVGASVALGARFR